MKKKLIWEYNWFNRNNRDAKIPVHHETALMGAAEKWMIKQRLLNIRSGGLMYTYNEKGRSYVYAGYWSVKYEYEINKTKL
ncbi:MAG: hypothetical protein KAG26_08645 [Methylococcales bacterium]|nr:hypothetical protein [Methylococcales bacterium]